MHILLTPCPPSSPTLCPPPTPPPPPSLLPSCLSPTHHMLRVQCPTDICRPSPVADHFALKLITAAGCFGCKSMGSPSQTPTGMPALLQTTQSPATCCSLLFFAVPELEPPQSELSLLCPSFAAVPCMSQMPLPVDSKLKSAYFFLDYPNLRGWTDNIQTVRHIFANTAC